jgi:hypothetical protein
MSGIQLSPELVDGLKSVLVKHDPETANDLLFIQYLSAVAGFVLAHQDQPGLDKKAFLGDIHTFTGQVLDQVEGDMNPPQQEEAFGIWKPE